MQGHLGLSRHQEPGQARIGELSLAYPSLDNVRSANRPTDPASFRHGLVDEPQAFRLSLRLVRAAREAEDSPHRFRVGAPRAALRPQPRSYSRNAFVPASTEYLKYSSDETSIPQHSCHTGRVAVVASAPK